MRSDTTQLNLLRHGNPRVMADACRKAADSERHNPHFPPDVAEERAKHYEALAAEYEAQCPPST